MNRSDTVRKIWEERRQNRCNRKIAIIKISPVILLESPQGQIHPDIVNSSCWLSPNKHTHRQVWQKINGPRPQNMCICHKCDKIYGECCNPSHLFLGTVKDNMHDRELKARGGGSSETTKKGIETSKKNGTFYESRRKAAETMKANGSYEIAAKKCKETKIKNGTESKGWTSEMAKKAWDTKRKNGTISDGARKGWETRRKLKQMDETK